MPDQLPNWLKLKLFNVWCHIKTRSDTELAQTQSFCPVTPDQTRSDTEMTQTKLFRLTILDQIQIRYRNGSELNFSTCNVRSDTELAQTQSLWSITPDQN